jgi:uncharacterized protein YlxP (DUF503 family)
MTVNIQYVGFKSKAIVREYSFLLRESSIKPREITFTILNEAFRSHGLPYQDAPDLCSLKLHRELAKSVDDPLKTRYRISGTELDDYRDSHSPKAAKALNVAVVGNPRCKLIRKVRSFHHGY